MITPTTTSDTTTAPVERKRARRSVIAGIKSPNPSTRPTPDSNWIITVIGNSILEVRARSPAI